MLMDLLEVTLLCTKVLSLANGNSGNDAGDKDKQEQLHEVGRQRGLWILQFCLGLISWSRNGTGLNECTCLCPQAWSFSCFHRLHALIERFRPRISD